MRESDAPVRERLALGFGSSTFRYAAPAGRDWTTADLAGKRIATAYPNLVRKDLADRGIEATVIRLDGAVEISVQLGVADAIADVVGSGRTLSLHDLVAFGEPLCDSEAVLIERRRPGRPTTGRERRAINWSARVQGVVFGQQYLMLDYDCPRSRTRPGHRRSRPDWSHRPSRRSPTRTGWRCARWCRAGASTRSWTSSRPSAPKRFWLPTSGSAASDPGALAAAVLASA